MRWYRRSRRVDLGRFVAPPEAEPASIDDLVEEGVLIAAAGVRLAVKNLIIVKSVRDGLDYSEERSRAAVAEELVNLSHEKDADADRVAAVRADASTRAGRPEHHSDFRAVDLGMLDRRERVLRQLADRLRALSADESFVRDLVAEAHAQAWGELAASIEAAAARRTAKPDKHYARERGQRLFDLLGDLADLEAEQARRRHAERPATDES